MPPDAYTYSRIGNESDEMKKRNWRKTTGEALFGEASFLRPFCFESLFHPASKLTPTLNPHPQTPPPARRVPCAVGIANQIFRHAAVSDRKSDMLPIDFNYVDGRQCIVRSQQLR